MSAPSKITNDLLRRAADAAGQLRREELTRVWDPARPGSRPTAAQQAILDDIGRVQFRYVTAGNQSGKSALAARELGWILGGNHPTWTRPPEWGSGPLTVIIAGQDKKMMELELWRNKLLRFLDESEWREVRAGQQIQFAENTRTGDTVVFISHADSSEKNRKHMQGYVAHYVWLDEMPASTRTLEELQRRVDSRHGYFVATFTPKFKSAEIRKVVDAADLPIARKYTLSKLDNPLFAEDRDREMAKLAGYSEQLKRAILYGDWLDGDHMVHQFLPELHGGTPTGYTPAWPHVAVADPATESKLGLTVWARDPANTWWCILDDYVAGIYVPTRIIAAVEERLRGLNVVERRCDSHEGWFIRQAAEAGFTWRGVANKTAPGRKDQMIRRFQEALGARVRIADWCTRLQDELAEYERDPETGKIRKASRFHLIDTCHYFADAIPVTEAPRTWASFEDRLIETWKRQESRRESARQLTRRGQPAYTVQGAREADPLPPMPAPRIRSSRRQWRVG